LANGWDMKVEVAGKQLTGPFLGVFRLSASIRSKENEHGLRDECSGDQQMSCLYRFKIGCRSEPRDWFTRSCAKAGGFG